MVVEALGAAPDPAFDELLGTHAAQRVRLELRARARRWAAAAGSEVAS